MQCDFVLVAEPMAPRLARRRVRFWLTGLGWPADGIDDIEYAISEAVSNAVEHGYRSAGPTTGHASPDVVDIASRHDQTVTVTAHVEADRAGRRIRVEVLDHGHWRPPNTGTGFRGHGMSLMSALMSEVSVRHDHHTGTEVTMLSGAAPTPATTRLRRSP